MTGGCSAICPQIIETTNALVDALVPVVAKAGKSMTGYICHEVVAKGAEGKACGLGVTGQTSK